MQIGPFDHTYVADDAGRVWGCFGRDTEGSEICSGDGDSGFAECLSQPDATAGIRYAKTGVCHQAANRILYPAMQFVNLAKGYRLSVDRWGVYGKGDWPELRNCRDLASFSRGQAAGAGPQGPQGPTEARPPKGGGEMPDESNRGFAERIKSLYQSVTFGPGRRVPDLRQSELEAMFDSFLGKGYDRSKRKEVLKLHEEFHRRQDALDARFDQGKVSPEEYFQESNVTFENTLVRCETVLGPADFRQLFGASPKDAAHLVDEAEFFRQHQKR